MISTPVVPTLHSGIGVLTSLPEKSAYLLRHILSNPGKAHQATEFESVSIRQYIYKHEQNPELLCSKLKEAIEARMQFLLKYPSVGEQVEIGCEHEFRADGATYDIHISISGLYYENNSLKEFYQSQIFELTSDKILQLKLEGTPYE